MVLQRGRGGGWSVEGRVKAAQVGARSRQAGCRFPPPFPAMKPHLPLVLLSLMAVAMLPPAAANEFAAAEASASGHGVDALVMTTPAIAEADLRCHVNRLASEEYEGRGTADRGERMATAYVASFFEGLGLRPDGDDGTWFQEFEFPAGMTLAGNNSLSLRIDEPIGLVRRFRPGEHYQPLPVSTGGKVDAGVVFAGFGIETKDYDSFEGLAVKGRWVMVLRGQPKDRKDLARFGSVVAKVKTAQKKGAAGVILIKKTTPAVPNELIPPGSSVGSRQQILPAVTISDRLAAAMLVGIDDDKQLGALFAAYDCGERVRGFPLPFQCAAEIGIAAKEDTGRNVLARLQAGDEPSGEVIVFGAHVDHLGRGDRGGSRAKGTEAGRIHVGADDNASGVAAMMEVGQLLAERRKSGKLQLQRDIVFAAWSGEELGLRGSRCFLEKAKAEEGGGSAIAAYLNLDMVGRARDNGFVMHGTASSKAWNGILDAVGEIGGLETKRSESPHIPSDSISFYNAGVPILAAFTGLHDDFHKPSDTIDKIDFAGLDQISRYMAELTVTVANPPAAPDYVKVPRGRKSAAIPKVWLGVGLETHKGGGVLLTHVMEGSPAGRAGLHTGDVLLRFSGMELKNKDNLLRVVGNLKAGKDYKAVVRREDKELEVTVTPKAR